MGQAHLTWSINTNTQPELGLGFSTWYRARFLFFFSTSLPHSRQLPAAGSSPAPSSGTPQPPIRPQPRRSSCPDPSMVELPLSGQLASTTTPNASIAAPRLAPTPPGRRRHLLGHPARSPILQRSLAHPRCEHSAPTHRRARRG
jgi:hypothetical protein